MLVSTHKKLKMRQVVTGRTPPAYPVERVGHVLGLLELLEERQRVKLSDVSAELGIGVSTAHRLLSMFHYLGFVEKDEYGHAYAIGPKLITLAKSIAARKRILDRLRPVVEILANNLNETVHVAQLKQADVLYWDCIESKKSERATARTGLALPAHATASGKAILAQLAPSALEELFPNPSLARITSRTLATRDALFRDLDITRERGFATNENESQLGFFACACPITLPDAEWRLSIVVAAPSRRFRKHRSKVAEALCVSAEAAGVEVADMLGSVFVT